MRSGTDSAVQVLWNDPRPGGNDMQIEPEIALRHVELTEAAEELIREGISDLDKAHDRLTSCRLMVEMPDRHHRTGNHYHVRIDLRMPGHEIVINRAPVEHHSHEDLSQAILPSKQPGAR